MTTNPTILEWFEELEPLEKENAIEEVTLRHMHLAKEVLEYRCKTAYIALSIAFIFSKSKYGADYWFAILKRFDK